MKIKRQRFSTFTLLLISKSYWFDKPWFVNEGKLLLTTSTPCLVHNPTLPSSIISWRRGEPATRRINTPASPASVHMPAPRSAHHPTRCSPSRAPPPQPFPPSVYKRSVSRRYHTHLLPSTLCRSPSPHLSRPRHHEQLRGPRQLERLVPGRPHPPDRGCEVVSPVRPPRAAGLPPTQELGDQLWRPRRATAPR